MHRRSAIGGLLAIAALAAAATPALAHTELVATSPTKGAVVKHLPATVTLSFTEAPQRIVSGRLLVAGSTTSRATRTKLAAGNARKVLMTTRGDAVGQYTVIVKLMAPDGDPQSIVYRFRVKR